MTDLELRQRVETLERLVVEMGLSDRAEPDVPTQSRWTCAACLGTLGWLDPADGVIRRKVGPDVTFVALGVGGQVTAICGACGAANTITETDCRELRGETTSPTRR